MLVKTSADWRALPRCALLDAPTPLHEAKQLTKYLGGPRILFKRDDLTGVGLGGNKVRKLEYIFGKFLADGCDTVIVCGGYQSNLARITAAIGAGLGLRVEAVLAGVPGETYDYTGNLLLTKLLGANIHFLETEVRWEFGTFIEDLAADLTRAGRKVGTMPLGGASAEGMLGYIKATGELIGQCQDMGCEPSALVVAIGSGGTYGGLVLGQCNDNPSYAVHGISVSRTAEYLYENVPETTRIAAETLGLASSPRADQLHISDRFVGEGYGACTPQAHEAIALVAGLEGVLLDPVYSGKSMAGLIAAVREGVFSRDDEVIFLHTGGFPALFAYEKQMVAGV